MPLSNSRSHQGVQQGKILKIKCTQPYPCNDEALLHLTFNKNDGEEIMTRIKEYKKGLFGSFVHLMPDGEEKFTEQ